MGVFIFTKFTLKRDNKLDYYHRGRSMANNRSWPLCYVSLYMCVLKVVTAIAINSIITIIADCVIFTLRDLWVNRIDPFQFSTVIREDSPAAVLLK